MLVLEIPAGSKMAKKTRLKFIIGGVIIALAVGILVFAGMQGNEVYYLSPSELLSKEGQGVGLGARVAGKIEDGSINWNSKTLDLSFKITDGKQAIPVQYHGVIPDTFKYGVEVVVEGKLQETKTFMATKLMAKCPSKYEPQT